MKKRSGNGRECLIKQRGFGNPDILAIGKRIDMCEKMGTKEPFRTVAIDRVAYFFPCDKTDTFSQRILAKEKDKGRGVPSGISTAIDRIKFPRSAEAVEVF
jgi:hypothetical protein